MAQLTGRPTSAVTIRLRPPLEHQSNRLYELAGLELFPTTDDARYHPARF